MGHFPNRVPLLVTRRVHWTAFRLLSAVGAVAYMTTYQWFAPTIPIDQFRGVQRTLGLTDARQLADPDRVSPPLRRWFTNTLRGPTSTAPGRSLIAASAERWAEAAPVCAGYADLRKQLDPEERLARYAQLLEDLDEAGLDVAELRRAEVSENGGFDWSDVI